jgi:hypothetical protein
MDVSLSDEQMLSIIPKANFIPYDKLINMRDIHEVLGPNGISIILYLLCSVQTNDIDKMLFMYIHVCIKLNVNKYVCMNIYMYI